MIKPCCLLTVPAAPQFLTISQVTPNNVTLRWAPPHSVPGLLKEYHIVAQLISANCEPSISVKAQSTPKDDLALHCIEHNVTVSINASDAEQKQSFTIHPVAKYRHYRFKVAAVTNAGVGDYTQWKYKRTMAGSRNDTDDVTFLCCQIAREISRLVRPS